MSLRAIDKAEAQKLDLFTCIKPGSLRTQQDLDEVRAEARDLGGIPKFLESALDGKGVRIAYGELNPEIRDAMGGSYYMIAEKVVVLNATDAFYVAENGTAFRMPLAVILYHELGHAYQYIVDKVEPDRAKNPIDKIEHDNIVRFEWPMCECAKLPLRKSYNLHWGISPEDARDKSKRILNEATLANITRKLPRIQMKAA